MREVIAIRVPRNQRFFDTIANVLGRIAIQKVALRGSRDKTFHTTARIVPMPKYAYIPFIIIALQAIVYG
jgi:hypothetical protein